MSFNETQHPRGQVGNAGQFRQKTNSAPNAQLASTDGRAAAAELALRQRAHAESFYMAARDAYFRADRDAVVAVLREQFPDATTAVFERNMYSDCVTVQRLVGEDGLDIDIRPDGRDQGRTPHRARIAAEVWAQEMGDDISDHLEEGDKHDSWSEYHLDLSTAPDCEEPTRNVLSSLSPASRSSLDAVLSEMDGRMISTVDTDEIAYQLSEGGIAEENPDLSDRLTAKYGDLESAAAAIASSGTWSRFRDDVDEYVRDELFERISAAAEETLA